jgi:rRNA-processing protein FCF1
MASTLLSKNNVAIILDTNLLFASSTRDLFVHLAIKGYFKLLLPEIVLEELARTLRNSGQMSHEGAASIAEKLSLAFDTIRAPSWEKAALYTSDPKDEFLVGCVRSFRPNYLVTRNTKDFLPMILDTQVISGSHFIQDLFESDRKGLSNEISLIAARYQNPRVSSTDYLRALGNQGFDWLVQP